MEKNLIKILDSDLRGSIIKDVKNIALYHSRQYKGIEAGFFSVPRQVFCYIDHLGFIAFGWKSPTQGAEDFIKTYFPINYHPYAELLYSMWRHGTVHEYGPKSYYLDLNEKKPRTISIRWLANNSGSKAHRKENLKFYYKDTVDNIYLVVNICQLVDDLIYALDSFIRKLKSDKSYKKSCENRLKEVGVVESTECILRAESKRAVRKQIELARENLCGEINEKGDVIKRFKVRDS